MTLDAPRYEALAHAVGDGDVIAAAPRYRSRLLRYFERHLNSREEAEDLAQETLVRVMSTPPSTAVANMEAYLLTIAGNLLRDRFRRIRTHADKLHVPLEEAHEAWTADEISSERVYQDKERLRIFMAALAELSPRCRQVFLLQRYDGLTYGAIARQLGISVSAVEKQMMHALLHFRSRMDSP